ncbi:SurA N-terminal domain-containing protein [Mesorhizobium sp. BAC0120]|uniref:SurA N-terminal domain-containing protein n=1 Tax=Mesorhizobium sp. BAC0120 TaxID=3090670 RepID=UPI00298C24FD|nr:SurA N-terminal domain-containing protein [Mesorhizobium sp. BAC0120]MDW6022835.1 SurA N-terminal domain-containing protein [Mesorhizobium sp. BAC0120]
MLDALRTAAGTWVAKLLLFMLVVSFAIWGISGRMITGFGSPHVIEAGGTAVSMKDYRLAYDRQMQILSQQFGTRLTREQAKALGLDQQVLGQLTAGAVLDEQARKLGLGVSKDRLAELARQDPAFRGPDGKFDRQQFEEMIRRAGMNAEDYLKTRKQAAVRQQILEAISDGLKAPATFLRAVALYRGENRTVDYVSVPRSLVEPIEEPADSALKSWFEAHKASYAAPEYRKISYIRLDPESIADPASISDEQVKKDYEQHIANYTTPEKRTIEQLVFPSEEAAKTAYDSTKTGSTFEDLVKGAGKTTADVELGTFTKEQVPDPAIADAAFALQPNQVSDVIKGSFGPVLVRVTAVTPQVVKSLDQVKEEIRKQLATSEASRILLDAHDSYEDARAGGATLAEAAAKLNLKVVTIDAIDRQAQRPDGTIVNDIPESAELLKQAFESEVGIENPAINIGSSGYVYYEVQGITPARDRTLEEVRDKVVADWKAAEAEKRLDAKMADLEKQVKDGADLDAIAAELKLEKQTKRGLKREADDADFGRQGVAAVFGVAQGGAGTIHNPAGDGRILFKVTEVFEPADAGPDSVPEEARRQFAAGLSEDLLDQLVAQLQTQYEVTVNQSAIQQSLAF